MSEPRFSVEDLISLVGAFSSDRHLEGALGSLLDMTCRLLGAEEATVWLLDRPARHLHTLVRHPTHRIPSRIAPEVISLYAGEKPNLTEPHAFAALTGRIVNMDDIYRYTGFDLGPFLDRDRLHNRRTGSMIVAPLRVSDDLTVGVIGLVDLMRSRDGRSHALPETHLPFFEAITKLFATAVRHFSVTQESRRLHQEIERLSAKLEITDGAEKLSRAEKISLGAATRLVGESPPIRAAVNLVSRAAASRVPVLLLGETGTGKEVFARAIHALSGRQPERFVVQNCAALPENLLESELFGHRKGAFTGATHDKIGLVQEAHNGTLFLDEIGDMPIGLQAKLLRFLQDGESRPVGSTKSMKVDVRIIAATNADLSSGMQRNSFRSDLFYRLNVFPITLPPLRERPSDIPALIEHFLSDIARSHQRKVPAITPAAADTLLRWRYPGNVRELKNIIERAVLLIDEGERIDIPHLPPELGGGFAGAVAQPAAIPLKGDLRSIMRSYEAIVLETKLREVGGNRSRAAKLLNISRRSLQTKLSK